MENTNNGSGFTLTTPVAVLLSGVLITGALYYGLVVAPKNTNTNPAAVAAAQGQQGQPQVKDISPVGDKDHIRGDYKTAELTMVEYSDLQCPYCGQFHPVIEQLKNNYGDKVAWAYRHFPLSQIHPEALPAAVASECVFSMKGNDAFWRFVDGDFVDQKNIGTDLFHKLAGREGISAADLDACIAKNDTTTIEASYNEAVAAGGTGTPFTVILDKNGKTVGTFPGAIGYAQGKSIIDALLAKK